MSVGRTDWNVPADAANVVIGDELYLSNQTRINQVQEYLNSWNALNEEGNRNFNQIQSELARKVQEGEEAKRQLEALRNSSHNRPLAITASGSTSTSQFTPAPVASYSQQSHIVPITATIEEVTSPTQPVTHTTRQTEPHTRWVDMNKRFNGSGNGPSHRPYQNSSRASITTYANGTQRGMINMDQWQRQQQYDQQGSRHQQQHQSQQQPTAPSIPQQPQPQHQQQSQQYYQQQQQQRYQQQWQLPQSKATVYPASQLPYYRSHVNHHAGAMGSTSISSSLAGALGQPGQSSSSSSVFRLDSAASISQPKQSAPEVAPNGHLRHSEHPSQSHAANVAPQSSTSASKHYRPRGSQPQLDSQPSPGFVPNITAPARSTSTTKPVQRAVPHSTGTSSTVTPMDTNPPENITLLAMDWARRAPPNSYFDVPNSELKLYKNPTSTRIIIVAPDGNGGFVPRNPAHLADKPPLTLNVNQDASGNLPIPLTAEQMKVYDPHFETLQRNVNTSGPIYGASLLPYSGAPPSTPFNLAVGQPASHNTPVTQMQKTPRTPAQANKAHLAKDILRALGHSSGPKRRRPDEEPQAEMSERGAKRRAVDPATASVDNMEVAVDRVVLGSAAPSEIMVAQQLEEEEDETSKEVLLSDALQTPPKRDQTLDVELKAEFEESPLPPQLQRPAPPTPNAFPTQRPPPQRSALFAEAQGDLVGENRRKPETPNASSPASRSAHPTAMKRQPPTYFVSTSANFASQLPSTLSFISRGKTFEASVDSNENEPSTLRSTSSSSKIPTPRPVTPEPQGFYYTGGAVTNKTPLFLPSPSESPPRMSLSGYGDTASAQYPDLYMDDDLSLAMGSLDEAMAGGEDQTMWGRYRKPGTFVEIVGDASRTKTKKRQQVYVLVPPLPEYVIRDKARRARQRETLRRKAQARRRGDEEEESDDEGDNQVVSRRHKENNINPNDVIERTAVQEASSRLRERPCLWNGCEVVMNSTEKLILHLAQHKPKKSLKPTSTFFSCLWKQCGLRFTDAKFMYHLESHALSPLFCAFQDCSDFFRTSRQLVQHNLFEHKNDFLRPSTDPFKPRIPPSLPAAPEVLPSYMVEPRSVVQASISKDRHKVLGEWVLRNIFGPVKLGSRKHRAAVPLRTSRRDTSDVQGIGFNQYDFLTSSSSKSTKMPEFDDLNSGEVSQLANQGLVLWHIAEVNDELENPMDSASDHDEVEILGKEVEGKREGEEKEGSGDAAASVSSNRDFASDEETVEVMLTGM